MKRRTMRGEDEWNELSISTSPVLRPAAPEGAGKNSASAVCLKAYPDTKRSCFVACKRCAFDEAVLKSISSIISNFDSSVVKAVTKFNINLPRIIPMEATESDAVVELDAAVGDIHGIQRGGEALPEVFADRKIEGRVTWQIKARIRPTG